MIDVIIPAYNAHDTLPRALCSIGMMVNRDEIKVTIVDDCSNEGYEEIAKQFQTVMDIHIIRLDKNSGPGTARRVGYEQSKGDYVTWMDADDTWISSLSLLRLKNIMEQGGHDVVYGQFLEQTQNGESILHEIQMVWMFGKLYRRSFLDRFEILMNDTRANEDTGFNSLVRGCTDRIWYIPEPVYIWHYKSDSITRIFDGKYSFEGGYKGYIDNMVWQIGELYKRGINKERIRREIVGVMCTLYFFHTENSVKYPLCTSQSLEWCRGFYQSTYALIGQYVTSEYFKKVFLETQKNQANIALGVIQDISIYDFMEAMKNG